MKNKQRDTKKINLAHYLLGCRFDNWIRLLRHNKGKMDPSSFGMRSLITVTSFLTFPFSGLEKLLFDRKIRHTVIEKDPIFIIGHWRSGTTYLQNLMTRDQQFGWCDPVSTNALCVSTVLRKPVEFFERCVLKNARPMDNLKYAIDFPMEDTFGIATISPTSIIHMISFPCNYTDYIPGCFLSDLTESDLKKWEKDYTYFLRKLTWHWKGKQLVLKSPDNTGHIPEILKLFPNAKFINIHRDPYTTVMSTVHMFKKQMSVLRLSRLPDKDLDLLLTDTVIDIFERMYRELFELENRFSPENFISIPYERFCENTGESLRSIYDTLHLDGFDQAEPEFKKHIESQKSYQKNQYVFSSEFISKINSRLDFYFTRYGYEMLNPCPNPISATEK